MTKDKQVTLQCPNCGQYKVTKRSAERGAKGMTMFIVGFPLILFAGVGFIMMPIGLVMMATSGRLKGYSCSNCKWRGEKLELEKPADPAVTPKVQVR